MKLTQLFETDEKTENDKKAAKKVGTFAALRVAQESAERLHNFAEDYGIANIVDERDMHVTLISSRKYLPDFEAYGILGEHLKVEIDKVSVWDTRSGQKALVVELDSDVLRDRHKEIMDEHEAEYDFDEYKPHVTLSYNIESDAPNLDMMNSEISEYMEGGIALAEEYMEPLDLSDEAKDD